MPTMPQPPAPRPPEGLQRLLEAEPDIVDRIFEYVVELMPEIAGKPAKVTEAKAAVRAQFAGDRAYVKSRGDDARRQLAGQVLGMFNGRNATEVARRLRISRATVYRYLKQSG
jgi:Mor family transcriptional regulator